MQEKLRSLKCYAICMRNSDRDLSLKVPLPLSFDRNLLDSSSRLNFASNFFLSFFPFSRCLLLPPSHNNVAHVPSYSNSHKFPKDIDRLKYSWYMENRSKYSRYIEKSCFKNEKNQISRIKYYVPNILNSKNKSYRLSSIK